jgi:LAS superfamily LD-carboxypeptidase LdcB
MDMNLNFLTGQSTTELVALRDGDFLVHRQMHDSLSQMFTDAQAEGFELALASSFRSFETQKKIWNEKASGKRPVLDSFSIPVDISTKTSEELLFLILRWSAIPGGSRHHWGSDIDVFDQKQKPDNYKLQLIPDEYQKGGLFYESTLWLNSHMKDYGFFKPYETDRGGIAPEPWHLSFKPLSERFLADFSLENFTNHLLKSDFFLKPEALIHRELIYNRFIQIF